MQIIQSGPSSATLRQQALDQALGNVVQGYAAYDKQEKDKLLTLRQQALQDAELSLKLQAQGIDASAKDLMDYSQGNYKPKEISPALNLAEGLQGPVKPAVMGNANPMQNYTAAKLEEMAQAKAKRLRDEQRENLEEDNIRGQIQERSRSGFFQERRDNRDFELKKQEFELKKQEIASPKASTKLSKMSADAQGKVGSIASGLKALKGLEQSISKGVSPQYLDSNTPIVGGLISDNSFTQNQRVLDEVIGRLQSGGAIGEQEVKTFRSLGPRPGDSPQIQTQKLQDQKSFLMNKLTAFGLQEGELGEMGFDIGGSSQTKTVTPPPPGTDTAFEAWKKAKGHI